jgi:hypothetical protein
LEKTIDNHIEILTRYGLVEEKMVVGTAKYYTSLQSMEEEESFPC